MVKYEGIENRYYIDKDIILDVVKKIDDIDSFRNGRLEVDVINSLLGDINTVVDSFDKRSVSTTVERVETEIEAREYFGEEFITKYEMLLHTLDNQNIKVALHGTSEDNAKEICDEGLKYNDPAIKSTAVIQSISLDGVKNYSELLNWKHREYKNLVIVGIPEDCFDKEGLWEKLGDGNSIYDGFNYKISEDFIVGYLDISNKDIVINPKYNSIHNYEGLEKDIDIYRDKVEELVISNEEINKDVDNQSKKSYVEEVNLDNCEELLEDATYIIRSTLMGLSNNKNGYLDDKFYIQTLNNISNQVILMNECMSFYSIDNNKQIEEMFSKSDNNNKDFDFDFGEDQVWDTDGNDEWINANTNSEVGDMFKETNATEEVIVTSNNK